MTLAQDIQPQNNKSENQKTDGVIELKITKSTPEGTEAKITNVSREGKNLNIDKISILGKLSQNPVIDGATSKEKAITEITWNEVSLKDKKTDLLSFFQSKIVSEGGPKVGDIFKAKGDQKALVEALNKLIEQNGNNITKKSSSTANKSSNASTTSSGESFATGGNNSSRLSAFSSPKQDPANISSTTTGEEVITNNGCAPRVDYQLNKVFTQERTTLGGKEIQSCKDSSKSYILQRDYNSCFKTIDIAAKKIISNFQYFYTDDTNNINIIDNCQADNTKTTPLEITKSYDECSDYIDLTSKMAYAQFKQTYKDNDKKDVLLQDCSIDNAKSYIITEDYAKCSLRHLFDSGYSIPQSRFFYIKNSKEIEIQSCQDTTKKYQHTSTSDTCAPIINNNQVTTFSRKYIVVDGVKQYVSECVPLNSNVTIKSENCITTPYTHDFVTNQSFQNKNYFYFDGNNNRVEVSTCIKSEESFPHTSDSSVCTEKNDDTLLQTTLYSKKYISPAGNKIYISECAAVTTPIPYQEKGYKWTLEYNLASSPIVAAGVPDNTYIGSKQGVLVQTSDYNNGTGYWTRLINQFDVSKYSTTGKCSSPSSLSYSANPIDLSKSDQSTIQYDNYVSSTSSTEMTYLACWSWSLVNKSCNQFQTISSGGPNTLYYQRCNNFRCPIYKFNKKPILQRRDGTELINVTKTLESKYTCGENGLNGVVVYY